MMHAALGNANFTSIPNGLASSQSVFYAFSLSTTSVMISHRVNFFLTCRLCESYHFHYNFIIS